MLLVMQILSEFRVPFAVLHDADTPLRRDGKPNGSWTANRQINNAIMRIRERGVRVVHRISIPGFEYMHLPLQHSENGELIETSSTDKPWRTVHAIRQDMQVAASILAVLTDLTSTDSNETPFDGDFEKTLMSKVQSWAKEHCPKDIRFGCQ
jgi:hypothetical protein